jgi:Nuclease-related domain
MSQLRPIRLRYRAVCVGYGIALPPGSKAIWDRGARTATCPECASPAADVGEPPSEEGPRGLERGEAGASARRRYERLQERREQEARAKLGRLGGLYLALSSEPQSTRAWASGSSGERKLGAYLDTLDDGSSLIVLHDRRIPGTRANIDHVAISSGGIFVIDAKHYSGRVQRIDKGGWFSSDERLYVGRRDRTQLVSAMAKQVEAVRAALGEAVLLEFAPTLTPVLCFVEADWSLFAHPFRLGGVWVEWRKSLGERLRAAGSLEAAHVQLLAAQVASALPAA